MTGTQYQFRDPFLATRLTLEYDRRVHSQTPRADALLTAAPVTYEFRDPFLATRLTLQYDRSVHSQAYSSIALLAAPAAPLPPTPYDWPIPKQVDAPFRAANWINQPGALLTPPPGIRPPIAQYQWPLPLGMVVSALSIAVLGWVNGVPPQPGPPPPIPADLLGGNYLRNPRDRSWRRLTGNRKKDLCELLAELVETVEETPRLAPIKAKARAIVRKAYDEDCVSELRREIADAREMDREWQIAAIAAYQALSRQQDDDDAAILLLLSSI